MNFLVVYEGVELALEVRTKMPEDGLAINKVELLPFVFVGNLAAHVSLLALLAAEALLETLVEAAEDLDTIAVSHHVRQVHVTNRRANN